MQTIATQREPVMFMPAHTTFSCAGSQSPGKDMPTQPAPDDAPAPKKTAPKKKK